MIFLKSYKYLRSGVIFFFAISDFSFAQGEALNEAKEPVQARKDKQEMADARKKRKAVFSKRHDMKNAKTRAEIVRQLKEADDELSAAVHRRAKALGIEIEGNQPNGGRFRLIDFDKNDQPIYEETHNVDAAITTAADLVRSNPAYNDVNGSSVTIGLWESSGIPRVTHREFGGRVTIMDGSTATSNHASHVAGTLISQGINAATLGMAPGATISAFNSASDESEMMANGASAPNTDKLYLSNHSYGVTQGWKSLGGGDWAYSGEFSDDDNPTNDYEEDFGRYDNSTAEWDAIGYNLPYYLIFKSAGNARTNTPDDGDTWSHKWDDYVYDSTKHPLGNRQYKDGWDNMGGKSLAKNIISVGNSDEGIDGGIRDPSKAEAQTASSRGPADDGRIKPDIHGNGTGLRSPISSSDTATASYSGTSMSSPNVCGSAALLVDYYSSRFPAQAMRASTLKALILHTADDRGTTGPDYKYGWGVMNTQAAAEVIKQHADQNGGAEMLESVVNDTTNTSRTHSFTWDGDSPLRVSLCWTDPPGEEVEGHDQRERHLVNDLNLTVTGPGSTTHLPYVMPYVGNWSLASIDDRAVNGVNHVDNIEQVYLPSPTAGEYVVTVDFDGALTNDSQDYSLIVTGQEAPLVLTEAEIEVEYLGPPVAALIDGFGTQSFGAATASSPSVSRIYTIRNTGDSPLTGLSITKSGDAQDDFSVGALSATMLTSGQTASFGVIYKPRGLGARTAAIHIASNDADESPFNLNLAGFGLSEVAAWRLEHFGAVANEGDAADDADFDHDGLVNLVEFGFAENPTEAGPDGITFELNEAETHAKLTYFRSVPAMNEYDFDVIWADDLEAVTWSTAGVTEEVLVNDGSIQEVSASIPMGVAQKRFFKIRMIPK